MAMSSFKVFLKEEEICKRTQKLGEEITANYKALASKSPLLVVGVLNGSFVFMADLIRAIEMDCEIDFIQLSSYEGTSSSGKVVMKKDFSRSIEGRDVLLVEDIVDTGLSMSFLLKKMRSQGAASVKLCSLLSKPSRREVEVKIDYLGFEIEDHFVVGYGLDYEGRYRQLKDIVVYSE